MKYGYPEPPWTYSPKEVDEWINAVYGKHKCKKSKIDRNKKWLKNIELDIDLDVEKEIKKPSSNVEKIIKKITGYEQIEEHFEIIPTTEILLRALSSAGFKKVKVRINGDFLEEEKIRKVVEKIAGFVKKEGLNEIEIHSEKEGKVSIKISKIHSKKKHSIEVKIDRIKEKDFQKILIYIRKRLRGKEEIK
ncbi:MAG TPA: hypothetical protein ENI33_07075 [Thermoplasmatales archaeon]|nr:hypothetical protein [Thermoplasmatales archaeon]